MSLRLNLRGATAACALAATVVSGSALASTITQNTSWTINRSGATSTYRVVAYGDSIFAGYNGGLFSVARRAQPYTSGEYLGSKWNANIEVVRRTKSGAKADDIYNNKIISEKSYMQSSNTRVVMFEMCGNDYLQARSAFAGQSGTCDYSGLDSAYNACVSYMEKAMQAINTYATTAKVKVIMNIYYPGYDADNSLTKLHRLGDRAADHQAGQVPAAAGQEQLEGLLAGGAVWLQVRGCVRRDDGRGLRLQR